MSFESRLNKQIEKIKKSRDITEGNRKLLLRFFEKLQLSGKVKVKRQHKYVYSILLLVRYTQKEFKKDLDKLERPELEQVVRWIDSNPNYTDWTKYDYKVLLRKFYKVMEGDEDDPSFAPQKIRWLRPTVDEKLSPPSKLVKTEDVDAMIKVTNNIRDKALMRFLFTMGVRASELLDMRIGDIDFKENCVFIRGTKSRYSQRTIPMLHKKPVPLISKWLEIHPDPHPDNFVWVANIGRMKDGRRVYPRMCYGNLRKTIKGAYKKAGIIGKFTNPHSWRKASATAHSKYFRDYASFCTFYGWRVGSTIPQVYYRATGKDLVDSIAGQGQDRPEPERPKNAKCMNCGTENDLTAIMCSSCGHGLTEENQILVNKVKTVFEAMFQQMFPDIKKLAEEKKEELRKEIDIEKLLKESGIN